VRRAARTATLHQRRLAAEKDARMAEVLRAEGVQIHQPDAAFLEACRRRVAPILDGAATWVGPEAAAVIPRLV
jgi:TRAP-type C4-dicarboxylate transport system substrate-binding protein